MRPEAWRLDSSAYPATLELQTRFGDLDPLGHLNNVALARAYEEGRVRFSTSFSARQLFGVGGRVVVARVVIDYLEEAFYPAPVTVFTGVSRVGGASYAFGQLLMQGGRAAGLAETVLVYTSEGRSSPLPDAFRDALNSRRIAGAPPAASKEPSHA